MSQLSPFVRAFRALAKGLRDTRPTITDEPSHSVGLGMLMTADAFDAAATNLEQQIARDLTRVGPMVDEVIYDGNLYRRDAADAFIKVGPVPA